MAHCLQHRTKYDTLYDIILKQIRKQARQALRNEDEIGGRLMRESKRDKKSEYALVTKAIAEDTARLSALDKLVSKLYEDIIADRISPDNFNALLQKSQAEQASLKNRVEHNTARIEEKEQSEDNSRWIGLIREYADVKELDAAILNQLIKKIVIHEDMDESIIFKGL